MTESLLLLLALILVQGFIAAMYYSLTNARKGVLKERAEEGHMTAQRTLRLAENASALLLTQQFISVFLTICSTAVLVEFLLPDLQQGLRNAGLINQTARSLSIVLGLPIFTLLVLIIGYQLPGLVVSGRAESVAMLASLPMSLLVNTLAPLLRLMQPVGQTVGRLLGGSGTVTLITEEEIKTLVDAGSQGGVIETDEREMIYSVFKFGDTLAREVMVPRIDIQALEVSTGLDDALNMIIQVGHSRIPIYEESIDNIRGLLYAKDLLAIWRNREQDSRRIKDILREPHFIPESKKAGDLLQEMQQKKVHLAIVIDEYGGTAGLVTIEDLLEEIVGEIRDEYDLLEEEPYEKISDTEYICQAGFDLDDLNDLLKVDLPTDENDTVGGLIFTELGEVPEPGDQIVSHGVEMQVVKVDGRRIHKVRVRRLASEKQDEEEQEQPSQKDDETSEEMENEA